MKMQRRPFSTEWSLLMLTISEIFEDVLKSEGGFTDHPHDNGGPTKFGITWSEWQKWVHPRSTTFVLFKKIEKEDALAIYRAWYWDPLKCQELPPGVAYQVFDAGLLHGIFNSARWLQLSVGVKADGHVGPKTIAATLEADDAEVITSIHNFRMKRIKAHADYKHFGRGWTNRLLRVKKKALQNVRVISS
jgi:lysozyme family protein